MDVDSGPDLQTPPFSVTQDDAHVYVTVKLPPSATTQTPPRVVSEDRAFGFVADQFYLPLFLPAPVQTNPKCEAEAAGSSSETIWKVSLVKAQNGHKFPDLDSLEPQILPPDAVEALAKASDAAQAQESQDRGTGASAAALQQDGSSDHGLQALASDMLKRALSSENSRRHAQGQPGLVLSTDDDNADEGMTTSHRAEDAKPAKSKAQSDPSAPRFGYGFRAAVSEPLDAQAAETSRAYLLKHADPATVSPGLRHKRAWEDEEERWDMGWYIENYLDLDGEVKALIQQSVRPPDAKGTLQQDSASSDAPAGDLEAVCTLWTLLFAYAYDWRTTFGDPTIESGWTISALCRQLSFLAPANASRGSALSFTEELFTAVLISFRRSLCMPLYRHRQLSLQVYKDVEELLRAGPGAVIAALQGVHTRLQEGAAGPREDAMLGLYATVWTAPLIAYLQQGQTAHTLVAELLSGLQALDASERRPESEAFKVAVGGGHWDLSELEEAAREDMASGQPGGYV